MIMFLHTNHTSSLRDVQYLAVGILKLLLIENIF